MILGLAIAPVALLKRFLGWGLVGAEWVRSGSVQGLGECVGWSRGGLVAFLFSHAPIFMPQFSGLDFGLLNDRHISAVILIILPNMAPQFRDLSAIGTTK